MKYVKGKRRITKKLGLKTIDKAALANLESFISERQEKEKLSEQMSECILNLYKRANDMGGIVGHIKGIIIESNDSILQISTTFGEIEVFKSQLWKESDFVSNCTVKITAIVIGIDNDLWVKEANIIFKSTMVF